jgi:hypothetical protein
MMTNTITAFHRTKNASKLTPVGSGSASIKVTSTSSDPSQSALAAPHPPHPPPTTTYFLAFKEVGKEARDVNFDDENAKAVTTCVSTSDERRADFIMVIMLTGV